MRPATCPPPASRCSLPLKLASDLPHTRSECRTSPTTEGLLFLSLRAGPLRLLCAGACPRLTFRGHRSPSAPLPRRPDSRLCRQATYSLPPHAVTLPSGRLGDPPRERIKAQRTMTGQDAPPNSTWSLQGPSPFQGRDGPWRGLLGSAQLDGAPSSSHSTACMPEWSKGVF